jgi:hypothetical protein
MTHSFHDVFADTISLLYSTHGEAYKEPVRSLRSLESTRVRVNLVGARLINASVLILKHTETDENTYRNENEAEK